MSSLDASEGHMGAALTDTAGPAGARNALAAGHAKSLYFWEVHAKE
jgi:hypothetical protein